MIRTLPILVGALLLSTLSYGQIEENFEGGLNALSGQCWEFNNVKYTQKGGNPDYVITGNGSIYSNPPVNNTNFRTLATPFLDIPADLVVSFNYKLSSPLKDGATRIIEIGLEDKNGEFLFLGRISTSDEISPKAQGVQTYQGDKDVLNPGVYRFVIRTGGQKGDGNCRIVIDDLKIGADYHYTNHCNSAPIAVDDNYTILKSNMCYGSSVLANDEEPDGEQMTASLVTPSPDGEVNFNADGSFYFKPNPQFTGESTTFTYKVTDDGYTPVSSNTATVTIKFEEPAPVVHLIDFTGKMNKQKVQLHWQVSLNEMLDHFEVEKSSNGRDFSATKTTQATTKTGVEDYDAMEATTASTLQYRLKLVSANGAVEYSKVISLTTNEGKNAQPLTIVTNPVTSNLLLSYTASVAEQVTISVYSSNGSPVYTGNYTANEGINQYQINAVSQLKKGTYFINITNDKGEKYSSSFVKL